MPHLTNHLEPHPYRCSTQHGLAPLTSWYELADVPLVAGALALLARDYDRSLLDMVRRQAR